MKQLNDRKTLSRKRWLTFVDHIVNTGVKLTGSISLEKLTLADQLSRGILDTIKAFQKVFHSKQNGISKDHLFIPMAIFSKSGFDDWPLKVILIFGLSFFFPVESSICKIRTMLKQFLL